MTRTPNYEKELNRLFIFISQIAISIRMNSDYCSVSKESESTGQNVMWLSDILHNLDLVGEAISMDSKGKKNIDSLKNMWLYNKDNIELAIKNSPYSHADWNIDEGIAILDAIANKLSLESA